MSGATRMSSELVAQAELLQARRVIVFAPVESKRVPKVDPDPEAVLPPGADQEYELTLPDSDGLQSTL